MHSGNGDAVFEAHQLGQHLRPLDDRHMPLARGCNFRVVFADGGAGNNHLCAFGVLSAVSFKDGCAQPRQTLGHGRKLEVGAGNLVSEREQNLGDAAHADAANADKMNALYLCEHG